MGGIQSLNLTVTFRKARGPSTILTRFCSSLPFQRRGLGWQPVGSPGSIPASTLASGTSSAPFPHLGPEGIRMEGGSIDWVEGGRKKCEQARESGVEEGFWGWVGRARVGNRAEVEGRSLGLGGSGVGGPGIPGGSGFQGQGWDGGESGGVSGVEGQGCGGGVWGWGVWCWGESGGWGAGLGWGDAGLGPQGRGSEVEGWAGLEF